MNTLCTLPGVGELFIGTCANITSDQGIHGLGSNFSGCLACSSDLCDLCIKHTLLVRIDLKCSQHIDLLNQKRRRILLSELLSDGGQYSGRISVLIGFAVEFDCLHFLVLLYQVIGVSLQQLLDLQEVVLLGKLNSLVPLIQQDTAVDSLFDIASLNEALHGQFGDAE